MSDTLKALSCPLTPKQGQQGFLVTGVLEMSPGSGHRETWLRHELCLLLCAPERPLYLEARFCLPHQGNRGILPSSR